MVDDQAVAPVVVSKALAEAMGSSERDAIRALTKHEEGGDRRTGKAGAHADFILAVRRQGPGRGRRRADARELRIMVQAKRANPSQTKWV